MLEKHKFLPNKTERWLLLHHHYHHHHNGRNFSPFFCFNTSYRYVIPCKMHRETFPTNPQDTFRSSISEHSRWKSHRKCLYMKYVRLHITQVPGHIIHLLNSSLESHFFFQKLMRLVSHPTSICECPLSFSHPHILDPFSSFRFLVISFSSSSIIIFPTLIFTLRFYKL